MYNVDRLKRAKGIIHLLILQRQMAVKHPGQYAEVHGHTNTQNIPQSRIKVGRRGNKKNKPYQIQPMGLEPRLSFELIDNSLYSNPMFQILVLIPSLHISLVPITYIPQIHKPCQYYLNEKCEQFTKRNFVKFASTKYGYHMRCDGQSAQVSTDGSL